MICKVCRLNNIVNSIPVLIEFPPGHIQGFWNMEVRSSLTSRKKLLSSIQPGKTRELM
jgi:hypothetical protein